MSSSAPFAAFAGLAGLIRLTPTPPLHAWLRSTGHQLRPPRPRLHAGRTTRARDAVLAAGRASLRQEAEIRREWRGGPCPTIVLGGFVPDALEQVFLLRGFLLRQGAVYYCNYPRRGFSLDLLCAQLDDLAAELAAAGRPPVVLGVSFGAGVLLEWMRRGRAAGRPPPLAGAILVSPVAAAADILAPGEIRPSTLLGRALRPYLDPAAPPGAEAVERSRAIVAKMFEAGAQNREAALALMTPQELRRLKAAVLETIRGIDSAAAVERVQALRLMHPLAEAAGRLSEAPALVLYAEKEEAVLHAASPTRAALETRLAEYFPAGERHLVVGRGSPVQHASLIFHHNQFLRWIAGFYQRLRGRRFHLAA